ncbi:uncharacterized protein LOC135829537 [Sycon ciliatum]|uniref:uncharacterized protein LOC135829537 n=1 Tax=Sycon ciliatum TaxID=27933 RepID=UPI0031F691FC
MGGCMSSQGRESPDLDPAGRVVPADASSASCSTNASNTPTKSVFPPNGDVPVDNRPKLQQQPRRKSLDAPAPVIPSRDELMEAKRKGVELSASQTEFFRMLDEKVEAGGPGLLDENDSALVVSPIGLSHSAVVAEGIDQCNSGHGLITT